MNMAAMWMLCFLLATSYCQSWAFPTDAKEESRIVYPVRVDSQGHVISQDVTSGYHSPKHGGRTKRHATEVEDDDGGTSPEDLYIVINKDNEELFLRLTPNTKLITPYTVIEWVMGDGRRILKHATGDCFYVGRLQDAEQSLVAISNCNGLTGYIQTQNASYFIEPLKGSRPPDEGAANEVGEPQPHRIYTVDSITSRLNISFQQDQEFQEEEEEATRPDGDHDVTFLELDDLFRKKRSANLPLLRTERSKRSVLIKSIKSKRRKRQGSETRQERGLRYRRATGSSLPKFARNKEAHITTPKFTRKSRPKYADRQSRSTSLWRPKFYVTSNASFENERQKRDGDPLSGEKQDGSVIRRHQNQTEIGREELSSDTDPNENEIQTEEKKEKRKNRKNRKNCKKRSKTSRSKGNGVVEEERGEVDEEDLMCKSRKPKRKLDKAERLRRKQERRERKRKKREQKRRERERKRLLREKRKQERGKRKGRGRVEEAAKLQNETRQESTTTSSMTTVSEILGERAQDPFEGDPWDGYSPDLFWETDIAAGSSALKEVSLGPALNVTDPPKWLELVVAVDHTVIDFHGDDEVEKYVFTLFNIHFMNVPLQLSLPSLSALISLLSEQNMNFETSVTVSSRELVLSTKLILC
ncbi:caldesmon-like [Palaemon carinicauda]|uniref:caldesmon-like n=1 Tax=Palaemon carinicauda TaxID=392227 RepID=UPI0035B5DF47